MQTLFGFDLSTAQKVMVASVVILVLLVLLGLFVRQIQGGRLRMKGQGGGRARQPRLGIVDTHDLDRQRQLVLIRRDNVEHLIMIGGASDVVVETNIVRAGRAPAPLPFDQGQGERPPAFEPQPPEPVRADVTRMEPPAPDMLPPLPVRASAVAPEPSQPVAPQPVPPRSPQRSPAAEADAAIAVGAALGAAVTVTAKPAAPAPEPTPSVSPPNFTRDHSPSPTASTVELDAMARQLEEALKRPFAAVRPAGSAPAPAVEPQDRAPPPASRAPEVRTEPRTPPAFLTEARRAPQPDYGPEAEVDVPATEPPAAPPVSARPVPTPIDVEAELEFALGLKPKRTDTAPPRQVPAPPEPTARDEGVTAPPVQPVAAAARGNENEARRPPPAPDFPDEEDAPIILGSATAPASETVVSMGPASAEQQSPAPGIAEPATLEPMTAETGSPDTVAAKPEAPDSETEPMTEDEPKEKAAEAQPAAIDPFSVDAIEAEFARLLGRDPKGKS